jgi:hypothetical protein
MSDTVDNNGQQLAYDPHDLGVFKSLYDAMSKYPNGGRLGDYITIWGVRHYWNEQRLSWGILEDVPASVVQMVEDMLYKLSIDGYAPHWLVFVFRQSVDQPDTPTGEAQYPDGWLGQPGSGQDWWISTGLIHGLTGKVIVWSEPVRFSTNENALQANIDAEATARAAADEALQDNIDSLNDYVDFMRGAQTISTVSGIQAMGTTTATITASAALSIANPARIKPGYMMSVRVRNMSGALIYVTLPTTSGWEVDKWYKAAVYPGKVTEIMLRGIANGLVAITYMVNKNSESILSPNSVMFDAAGNILV